MTTTARMLQAGDFTAGHRRLDIQGLRAVAVLMVVAFHTGLPVPGGFVGVDVFFVISGCSLDGAFLGVYIAREV